MKTQFGRDSRTGLDVPVAFIRRFKEKPKVILLPDGTPAKFWHPEGHPDVDQIETDERLDATVRPKTYRLALKAKA